MGRLAISRTQRQMPTSGPGVTGNVDVSSGAQAYEAAFASLGDAAKITAVKYTDAKLSNAKMKAEDRMVDLDKTLTRTDDPAKYPELYEKALGEVKGYFPGMGLGADVWQAYLANQSPRWRMAMGEKQMNRAASNWEAKGVNLKQRAIAGNQDDVDNYKAHLAKGVAMGDYDKAQAARELDSVKKDNEENRIFAVIRSGEYEVAKEMIESSSLDEKTKLSLEDQVTARKKKADKDLAKLKRGRTNEIQDAMMSDDIEEAVNLYNRTKENYTEEEQEQFEMMFKGVGETPETNYRHYMKKSMDSLTDYLMGDITEGELRDSVSKSRFIDQEVSQEDAEFIFNVIQSQIPGHAKVPLGRNMVAVRQNLNKGLWYADQEEAEDITLTQRALIDWVISNPQAGPKAQNEMRVQFEAMAYKTEEAAQKHLNSILDSLTEDEQAAVEMARSRGKSAIEILSTPQLKDK